MEKVDFFQKLGLASGLGLAFQGVKMSTFDKLDQFVSKVGKVMKKNVFGQSLGPKA